MPNHYHIILDAASMDGAIFQAREENKEYRCLFIGDSETTLASVAPWLFTLEVSTHFAEWLAELAPKNNWGIIIESDLEMKEVHRHLRRFLVVQDPEGKELFFRYFDPRVFRIFLPSCDEAQLQEFFGAISAFLVEGEDGVLRRYSLVEGHLLEESMEVDLAYHLTDIDFDHEKSGQVSAVNEELGVKTKGRWDF